MPFDSETTPTMRATALMTTAVALALWDAATNDSQRLDAGEAMAAAIRRGAPKKRATAAAEVAGPHLTGATLAPVLARLAGVVERKNALPVLSHVLIRSAGGQLTLTGTDLDLQWTETLAAEGLGEFEVAVPLYDLIGALRGHKGPVTLRDATRGAREPDHFVVVEAGGVETRLAGLAPSDFPVMEPQADYVRGVMAASSLAAALGFVSTSISTEETRYYLNGAYLHVATHEGARRLTIVTTDGHRMSLERLDGTFGLDEAPGVILPRKLVGWLVKHLDGEVTVEVSATGVRFTTARGVLTSKVVDGSFPDYMRVIPRDRGDRLVLMQDAKAADATLARLAATSRERSRSVHLLMGALGVLASVRNMEGGKAEATLPDTGVAGAPGEIGFNSGYVRDFLAHGGPVELHVFGANDPCRVEWPEQPNRIGVLMPMRV